MRKSQVLVSSDFPQSCRTYSIGGKIVLSTTCVVMTTQPSTLFISERRRYTQQRYPESIIDLLHIFFGRTTLQLAAPIILPLTQFALQAAAASIELEKVNYVVVVVGIAVVLLSIYTRIKRHITKVW